jgi:hypothetical protein
VAISKWSATSSIAFDITYSRKWLELLPSTYPLSKWYTNLKRSGRRLDVNNHIDKQEATLLYQEARKAPKSIKDFHKWTDNWEEGKNLVQRKKVSATLSPSNLFNDLMNALAGILPNWSESYVIHKGDEVEDETITFRTVAKDLRKVVENILVQDLPALQTVWIKHRKRGWFSFNTKKLLSISWL